MHVCIYIYIYICMYACTCTNTTMIRLLYLLTNPQHSNHTQLAHGARLAL